MAQSPIGSDTEPIVIRIEVEFKRVYKVRCRPQRPVSWLLSEVQRYCDEEGWGPDCSVKSLFNRTQGRELPAENSMRTCVRNNDVIYAKVDYDLENGRKHVIRGNSSRRRYKDRGTFFDLLSVFGHFGSSLPATTAQHTARVDEYVDLLGCFFGLEPQGQLEFRYTAGSQREEPALAEERQPPPRLADTAARGTFSDDESDGSISPMARSQRNSEAEFPMVRKIGAIAFKERSIGLVFKPDPTEVYTIVKKCRDGSEAARYHGLRGLIVVSVNERDVEGLGFLKTMSMLKEATRPLLIGFGKLEH